MLFFQRKPNCPNCDVVLEKKPTRKQECPHCGRLILVRNRKLVTQEQAKIMDWLLRLEGFGITRNGFDKQRDELSKQFGSRASINNTLWQIFNKLILKFAGNASFLEQVYREMASLVSSEGKDPTEYLIEAENIRRRQQGVSTTPQKQVFLGHDELRYMRQLRKEGQLDKAENLLLKAEPSPAVLDELRGFGNCFWYGKAVKKAFWAVKIMFGAPVAGKNLAKTPSICLEQ